LAPEKLHHCNISSFFSSQVAPTKTSFQHFPDIRNRNDVVNLETDTHFALTNAMKRKNLGHFPRKNAQSLIVACFQVIAKKESKS